MNAEQATKLIMQELTQLLSGGGRGSSNERISSLGPAGVMATACRHSGPDETGEAQAVIAVGINWQLARARPGRMGGGEVPSYTLAAPKTYPGRTFPRPKPQRKSSRSLQTPKLFRSRFVCHPVKNLR